MATETRRVSTGWPSRVIPKHNCDVSCRGLLIRCGEFLMRGQRWLRLWTMTN